MNRNRLAFGLLLAAFAVGANAQPARKPYIVQLTDAPVASYDGRISGYAATRPASGTRLNVNAGDVQAYSAFLAAKQSSVAAAIPNAPITYRFRRCRASRRSPPTSR
jgi:hypothetical protein